MSLRLGGINFELQHFIAEVSLGWQGGGRDLSIPHPFGFWPKYPVCSLFQLQKLAIFLLDIPSAIWSKYPMSLP